MHFKTIQKFRPKLTIANMVPFPQTEDIEPPICSAMLLVDVKFMQITSLWEIKKIDKRKTSTHAYSLPVTQNTRHYLQIKFCDCILEPKMNVFKLIAYLTLRIETVIESRGSLNPSIAEYSWLKKLPHSNPL